MNPGEMCQTCEIPPLRMPEREVGAKYCRLIIDGVLRDKILAEARVAEATCQLDPHPKQTAVARCIVRRATDECS